ncbi:MAG: penicillin-binding protein 2 [Proteobacteria bacterium]|nr:penicillin-binding protein 2 [Pseudomonadota bacterium]MCL2307176.1 penicillin-binding protein 2 [Pseudomonadota bacterium]
MTFNIGLLSSRRKQTPMPELSPVRALLVFGVLGALFLVLIGKALYLQWVSGDFLQTQGVARYVRDVEIPAHRGKITDRFGEPLAISTPVKSLWAFTGKLNASDEQMKALAKVLDTTPQALKKRIEAAGDFVYLAKGVSPEVAEEALALKIPGLYDERVYRRFYPAGELTSQILGFTDVSDYGQEGLELVRQDWLGGKSGSRRVIINRKGEAVEDVAGVRAPQEGRHLALSLDLRLQYLAQMELKAAIAEHKAKAGSLVMLDAQTGEVLALANWPTYNPNRRDEFVPAKMRNRALIDIFEPGSTFKPFTIAMALDAGRVKPTTMMETASGQLTIGKATIHDNSVKGDLTIEQVLQRSSNVGTAKVALMMPSEKMWQGLSSAGFGMPVNTGFPGESTGRLRPAKSWRPIEQATISYGHGVSVNLLQLARGYTIFTSDGELKPVSLYRTSGDVVGKPVISPKTAMEMRRMLEMAALPGGTGARAQVPDYRVAGKTGTARKPEKGGYGSKYVSSFVGFAPVSSPRLIVAVMIDEPSAGKYYGSVVAAPVFSNVVGKALRMLGVPPDRAAVPLMLPSDGEDIVEET